MEKTCNYLFYRILIKQIETFSCIHCISDALNLYSQIRFQILLFFPVVY